LKSWPRNLFVATASLLALYAIGIGMLDVAEACIFRFFPERSHAVDINNFRTQLAAVESTFGPVGAAEEGDPSGLQHLDPFEKHPFPSDDLVDQALTYLAQPGHTPLERRIAVLAVQKVSVAEWVRFASKMLDMYEAGQVGYRNLNDAIYPPPFYANHAENDFWRPGVRHVLYRLFSEYDPDNDLKGDQRKRILFDLSGLGVFLNWMFHRPRFA
jgi:hypothetical protein